MRPFIVYALPRSRTAWLAKFLSYGDWTCCHDIVVELHSFAELQKFFSIPYIGSAETGMVEGWRMMQKLVPDARRVVVRRPLDEVRTSLAKFGLAADEDMIRREKLLNDLSEEPGVLTVDFKDLDKEEVCQQVFEHCLDLPFDPAWWASLKDKNIQVDMDQRIARLQKNRSGINKLKEELVRYYDDLSN